MRRLKTLLRRHPRVSKFIITFRDLGAGTKKFSAAQKVIPPATKVFAPAYIFYNGRGDVKGCMLNTGELVTLPPLVIGSWYNVLVLASILRLGGWWGKAMSWASIIIMRGRCRYIMEGLLGATALKG